MDKKENASAAEKKEQLQPRTLGEEYVAIKGFKLKRVKLLVDVNGHSRELLPGAKMTEKFLQKQKAAIIGAVKIADAQECWCIRLPETFAIANIIVNLYESGTPEDEAILSTLFCNYANVSTVSDGLFHNLVLSCCTLYMLKQDRSKTAKEKKSEYYGVLKDMMKNVLNDLETYEQVSREQMEKDNEAFEKLIQAGEMREELNQPS